jgi:hypothetical protein
VSIPINVDVKGKRFTLDLYEDRGLGGDHWVITEKSTVPIPNDEVAAFTLSGDVGVHVEFFNDATKPKDSETWAEATLTVPGEILVVGNMRYNTGGYTHHKHPKHDNIDGKVSKIIVTQET